MVETAAYRSLKSLASRYPIVLISGPRGCESSSLARRLMPNKSFIDLDDASVFSLAKQSPKTFLLAFPDGAIIDSVDKLPEMVDAMRYHVGKWGFTPGKFIGVASSKLDSDTSDGRMAQCEVGGLTIDDMVQMKMSVNHPYQIMFSGQLQAIALGHCNLDAVLEDILQKDIRGHINISNLKVFRRFLGICASASARQFSLNRIAKLSGVSAPTAKTWLSVLERHQIVRDLSSSFFFSDSGVLCRLLGLGTREQLILSPYRDQVVRTFALNEIARGRFSKNQNLDVHVGSQSDFYADWNGGFDIMVDSNIEVTENSMIRALQNHSRKTVILYLGDVTYTKDGIDCISFRDITKLAMEIDYFS